MWRAYMSVLIEDAHASTSRRRLKPASAFWPGRSVMDRSETAKIFSSVTTRQTEPGPSGSPGNWKPLVTRSLFRPGTFVPAAILFWKCTRLPKKPDAPSLFYRLIISPPNLLNPNGPPPSPRTPLERKASWCRCGFRKVMPEGLLGLIIHIDLVDLDEMSRQRDPYCRS